MKNYDCQHDVSNENLSLCNSKKEQYLALFHMEMLENVFG